MRAGVIDVFGGGIYVATEKNQVARPIRAGKDAFVKSRVICRWRAAEYDHQIGSRAYFGERGEECAAILQCCIRYRHGIAVKVIEDCAAVGGQRVERANASDVGGE